MKRFVYAAMLLVLLAAALPMATSAQVPVWTQLTLGLGCPDWTRLDAEYYAPTGRAYILGGRGGTTGADTFGDIYALDPAINACTDTQADMPVPISNYTVVPVNNGSADLLCTFGGRDSGGLYSTAVQCYDPAANTATQVSTLPGNLALYIPGGAAAVGGKAYVFSGFRNTSTPYHVAETWEWDPVANTWTQKGDQSIGRGYEEVAVVDGKIYGFGGDVFDGTNLVAQTVAEVFDPAVGTWSLIAPLATASGEGRAYGFDTASGYDLAGKVVLAGGGLWPAETAAVLTYDVATDTYDDTISDLNISRRDHAGFFVPGVAESAPGKMWVYGGRTVVDTPPYAPPEYYEVAFTPPVQIPVHINKMKMNWAPAARPGLYKVVTALRVHDVNHSPVGGITVTGTYTYPDLTTEVKTFVTTAQGQAKFPVKKSMTGVYQFCVDDMTASGYYYDPAGNEMGPCLTVTVTAP
jgi:hypothetical protein